MATRLILSEFEFLGFEIPDSITLGGSQSLAVHKLPGGSRIIDSMGRDDAPLEWSGIFTGSDALNRALFLDNYRVQGNIHKLTIGTAVYSVVVRSFRPRYERDWHIPYTISCEVVEDQSNPVTKLPAQSKSIDEMITDAAGSAATDAAALVMPATTETQIRAAISDVQAKISKVQAGYHTALAGLATVTNLSVLAVSTIRKAIDDALISTTGAIALIKATVQQITALFSGYNLAGFRVGQGSAGVQASLALVGWSTAATNIEILFRISHSLTVANRNLSYIHGYPNAKKITVSGGTLAAVALEYYGDAKLWTVIAEANGLTNTVIIGERVLTIPPPATGLTNEGGGCDLNHWIGDDLLFTVRNDVSTVTSGVQRQQRILRRLLTNSGGYTWHPTYGAGVMSHVGASKADLPLIEGVIKTQILLERGAVNPSVAFSLSGDEVTANIQYYDVDTKSLQFLTFTVSA